ncbi:hypothetical protein [Azohydromonas australica]|uniref:hypothetical protein n=1 Tax=Azohydromonas australica TaxID=364039 RepID=UPI000416F017|nr:hypothetical protein [Azohydromonas australica]
METIAIQIPAAERGGTPREMTVRIDALDAQQRETLRWLPTNRAGTVPILRGPSRTTRMPAHMVAGHNGPVMADFEFKVPPQAIEQDIPGLLDLWRSELVKRKQCLSDREARRAARGMPTTGQADKRRRKGAAPVEPQESLLEAGQVAHAQAEPGAPEPGGDIAQVYRCLPLLRSVEVDVFGIAVQCAFTAEGDVAWQNNVFATRPLAASWCEDFLDTLQQDSGIEQKVDGQLLVCEACMLLAVEPVIAEVGDRRASRKDAGHRLH